MGQCGARPTPASRGAHFSLRRSFSRSRTQVIKKDKAVLALPVGHWFVVSSYGKAYQYREVLSDIRMNSWLESVEGVGDERRSHVLSL